jgi:hypothetical protein
MKTENGIGEGSGAMPCSTLSAEHFVLLLQQNGFEFCNRMCAWGKDNSSVGPVYRLWVNPYVGCDGCTITQKHGFVECSAVDIRMPETEEEFWTLCRALGVELDA